MTRQPLPLIDPDRSEFGFSRTVCACPACAQCCRHIPGYLLPDDLDRIRQHVAPAADPVAWARRHLLASPGALVAQRGRVFRIPTLVPARRPDGACMFLTADERCAIHPVAPFGCAFFDMHMPTAEADRRSHRGLQALLDAWKRGDFYAQVWATLQEAGLQAPAPEESRRQLRQAADGEASS